MVRDVRPMEISYKGRSATIDMPGGIATNSEKASTQPTI